MKPDKIFHAMGGFGIGVLLTLMAGPVWGIVAATAAGIGKELLDMYTKGTVDEWDAVVTAAGGGAGAMFAIAFLGV